ncbi:cytochrome c3 family protein [Thermodesulfatator autotrophicus]|nr:cytochrome c3 family protein [Thermodesulfatator autotrophicus]
MAGQKLHQSMVVMRAIRLKIKPILLVLSSVLWGISLCWAGDYLDSAHGNNVYGVKQINLSSYARGNCGHCHWQHASVDGNVGSPFPFALFALNFNISASQAPYEVSDNMCFLCHSNSSVQVNGIQNFDYSKTFGGTSNSNISSILESFNLKNLYPSASYHNLKDIYDFAIKKGWPFFKEKSNPCVACHNPHLAKRIKSYPSSPASYTAVSLPIEKVISTRKESHYTLWGDNLDERMSNFYSGRYQAPYSYGSTNTYEPGGTTIYDGSNLPDYATFCISCHNQYDEIYSTELGRNLRKIDWVSEGGDNVATIPYPDKHGRNSATNSVHLKDPYASSPLGISIGFVTSCTDCHEPHGSPNPYLLRTEVNGILITQSLVGNIGNELGYFCRACHKDDAAFGRTNEINTWEYIHHDSPDAPYPKNRCSHCHGPGGPRKPPIPCLNCHKHGSKDDWAPIYKTGRVCF